MGEGSESATQPAMPALGLAPLPLKWLQGSVLLSSALAAVPSEAEINWPHPFIRTMEEMKLCWIQMVSPPAVTDEVVSTVQDPLLSAVCTCVMMSFGLFNCRRCCGFNPSSAARL